MKYIFYSSKKNVKLRDDIIIKSNLNLETDLFGTKRDNAELYMIYDSNTNKISLFNNISKERKTPYRYIDISSNPSILFPIILSHINGKFFIDGEMRSSTFRIQSLSLKSKNNIFETLFDGNSFANPLVLEDVLFDSPKINQLFLHKDVLLKNNINFAVSSLRFTQTGLDSYDYDGNKLMLINYCPYNLNDENELFGCGFDEFFNGLKSLDITNYLNKYSGINSDVLQSILPVECEFKTNGSFKLRENDGVESFKIVSIKNNKEIINLRYCDFLDSIDVSHNILTNLIRKGKFISEITGAQFCLEINKVMNMSIDLANTRIINIPNIFNFKYAFYDLYKYEYCNQ